MEFLALDHISGGGNKHRKAERISYLPVWLQARKFPDGFQVLCHNCNMAKSAHGQCPHVMDRHIWPGVQTSILATIASGVRIGSGSTVWAFSVIEKNVKIGTDCVIGSHAFVGADSHLGDGVRMQTGAFICRKALVGNRVFIGPRAILTDDRHPRAGNSEYCALPPILEDDCSIGAGAVILPGIRIGRGAMVGAGAVVTQDVAPFAVVYGCPARSPAA